VGRPREKRAEIERAVVRVVAEKGLQGTTVQDIAAAAGVSQGLMYRYWSGRDELAGDVFRMHLLRVLARVGWSATSRSKTHRERLRWMVAEFLRFADEEPETLRFLLFTQHELSSAVPVEEGVHSFLVTVIRAGIATEEFQVRNADLAVQMAIGLVTQPVVGQQYGRLKGAMVDHLHEILAALERALGCKTALAEDGTDRSTGGATALSAGPRSESEDSAVRPAGAASRRGRPGADRPAGAAEVEDGGCAGGPGTAPGNPSAAERW